MDWIILYITGMIMTATDMRKEMRIYKTYSFMWWMCCICILLWPVLSCVYLVAWIADKIKEVAR
uniref:Uncharacterized protein n=1 Tax=viral metagenome TaxID=1070528 RepID=A0A6M3XK47_9ZZZZ